MMSSLAFLLSRNPSALGIMTEIILEAYTTPYKLQKQILTNQSSLLCAHFPTYIKLNHTMESNATTYTIIP